MIEKNREYAHLNEPDITPEERHHWGYTRSYKPDVKLSFDDVFGNKPKHHKKQFSHPKGNNPWM